MSFFRGVLGRSLCRLLLCLSFLCVWDTSIPGPSLASSRRFVHSKAWTYMVRHRSKKYAKARVAVISRYFQTKNPKLSAKSARKYAKLVDRIGRRYDLDPFLVSSIIVKESTVRVKAKSRRAYGLMQVNWKANRKWIRKVYPSISSPAKLLHSKPNIMVGCHILRDAMRRSFGDVDRALDRYRGKSVPAYRAKVRQYYEDQVAMFRKRR